MTSYAVQHFATRKDGGELVGGFRHLTPGPEGDHRMWFTAQAGGVFTASADNPTLQPLKGYPKPGGPIGYGGITASKHHVFFAETYGATEEDPLHIWGVSSEGQDAGSWTVPFDPLLDNWDPSQKDDNNWNVETLRWLWAMTYANNGYVYFAQKYSKRIGRFRPGPSMKSPSSPHDLTEFEVVTGSRKHSIMEDIVQGADDNLYWVDSGNHLLGCTGLDGTKKGQWKIDTDTPSGVTAGPDGNIWFTARTGDYIGKFNVKSREIDYRKYLPEGTGPVSITTGHNADVWFTADGTKRIGRMDFDTPEVNYGTWTTPKKDIWVDFIDLPDGPWKEDRLAGIAVGHDGRIWYGSTFHYGIITPEHLLSGGSTAVKDLPGGLPAEYGNYENQ